MYKKGDNIYPLFIVKTQKNTLSDKYFKSYNRGCNMLDNVIETLKQRSIAKEERKKLELERESKLEQQRFQLDMERLKSQTKLVSEGKVLPDDLDRLSMEQMEKSWKDEIIMGILFSPIVFVFFPWFQETISNGFDILNNRMPDWYMYMVCGIVVVTYGLRGMVKWAVSSKMKLPRMNSTHNPHRRASDKDDKEEAK